MQTTIAIIGGGVIGCLSAWRLAQAGHAVTLYEQGTIGSTGTPEKPQASAAAFGALVPYGKHRTDWLPTAHRESIAMWQNLANELRVLGHDSGYVAEGGLRVAEDGTESFDETMAYLSPTATMAALKAACEAAGVSIRENTPAPALQTLSEAYDHVVVACGLGMNDYLNLPPEAPLVRPVWGDVLLASAPQAKEIPLKHMVRAGKIFLIPASGNRFLIGGNKWHAGEEEPAAQRQAALCQQAAAVLHLPENALVVHKAWQGARPLLTRKRTTLFDVHEMYKNTLICAGYGGIGWCLAPGVAGAIVAHITEHTAEAP